MKTLSAENFTRARHFVKAKARPVDQALFDYTFEEGKPDAVWEALSAFANEDGGFGHGMEPDCRLHTSSMLGTITAFLICCKPTHRLITLWSKRGLTISSIPMIRT